MFFEDIRKYSHIEFRGDDVVEVINKLLSKVKCPVYVNSEALCAGIKHEAIEVVSEDFILFGGGIVVFMSSNPRTLVKAHRNNEAHGVYTFGCDTGKPLCTHPYIKAVCSKGKVIGISKHKGY